ncbi:transposase [Streptomyces sp. NPDC050529]|uniref:transposase n=1 Tax=Streptomyces sp. NPDC050529 TaxID=3365624 RepID=UPI0037AF0B2B
MGSKYTKRYTEEFKRDAIALVDSSGRTVTAVARELGISSEVPPRAGQRVFTLPGRGGWSSGSGTARRREAHSGPARCAASGWGPLSTIVTLGQDRGPLTSRPGQGSKGGSSGAGVLVVGDEPMAVDNHLIVAGPKSAGIDRCRELLRVLERPETAKWLDERIRCRHLTVTAIRSLPWDSEDGPR